MENIDKKIAYLLLRLALGVNIFIHGAARLTANYEGFVAKTSTQFASSPLPSWSVSAFAYALPVIEAAAGRPPN